jgi:multidrug efflux pump subunit AcrB
VSLTRVSLLRPLFIATVAPAVVIVGAVWYTRLGVDLLPAIDVHDRLVAAAGAAVDEAVRSS